MPAGSGRAALRARGPIVRILVFSFDRYAIFLARPGAQVDQFAALGAERAEGRFRPPSHWLGAARADDRAAILGHRGRCNAGESLALAWSSRVIGCSGYLATRDCSSAPILPRFLSVVPVPRADRTHRQPVPIVPTRATPTTCRDPRGATRSADCGVCQGMSGANRNVRFCSK